MEVVSTGSKVLDDFLEGGYPINCVISIYGPAGSGRTLLSIICTVSIAKNKKVAYIDADEDFSVVRLMQVNDDEEVLNNIIFLRPGSFEKQTSVIEKLGTINELGLVVLDSMSKLYRIELADKKFPKVNQELSKQMELLRQISKTKKIPVLVINSLSADIENRKDLRIVGGQIISYGSKCVLEVKKANKNNRVLILRKHGNLGERELAFKIVEKGIEKIHSSVKSSIE